MSDAPPIFNIVVTRDTFSLLRFFVCSLLHNSDAQFRLVANHCGQEPLALMNEYKRGHPGRVIEVLDVSPEKMVSHGEALDRVRAARDDGELFCLIDPDIKATAPFLHTFLEILRDHSAVTSGKEVWNDSNVVPEDQFGIGIGGRHFFHPNGFVYGSPHVAMYRRRALVDTCARWGVGLGSSGSDLSDEVNGRLAAAGHLYRVYDTGKVVNILLQLDGHELRHVDLDVLIHIGGMSHFLVTCTDLRGQPKTPNWASYPGMQPRYVVAHFTAALLRALAAGTAQPELPANLDAAMEERLTLVRRELIDLVERYRDCAIQAG